MRCAVFVSTDRRLVPFSLTINAVGLKNWVFSVAVPVFMQPDGFHPAAHYDLAFLQKKTDEVQFSTWLRVRGEDEKSRPLEGWVPASRVIDPIELAMVLQLERDEPLRLSPSLDQVSSLRARKGAQVVALEIQSFWAKVRLLGQEVRSTDYFLPRSSLRVSSSNAVERVVVKTKATLNIGPNQVSLLQDPARQLEPGMILQVNARHGKWLDVTQLSNRFSGYVEAENTISAQQISAQASSAKSKNADHAVLPRKVPLSLLSEAKADASAVHQIHQMTALKVVDARPVRWGRLKTKDHGVVHWQMDAFEDPGFAPNRKIETLSSEELLSRKPFDMAQSPTLKNLRIASANGIFKSIDGKKWQSIPLLQKKNFPIEFAPSGRLFVGPYVSDDHGHHFREWIRWDLVTSALEKDRMSTLSLGNTGFGGGSLRMDRIEVLDPDGRHVRLRLIREKTDGALGESSHILETRDQGQTWSRPSASI